MPDRQLRAGALVGLLLLTGCAVIDDLGARRRPAEAQAQPDVRDAAMVAMHLKTLESIARGTPAVQAELAEEVRSQSATDPTIFNRLRYALVLGLPAHTASDAAAARDALGTLLATPELMRPAEIAIAQVMLHDVNARIALAGSSQREALDSARDDNLKIAALNRRLQSQAAENARLHQELAEALAKLEAIATLERNLAAPRNSTERPP